MKTERDLCSYEILKSCNVLIVEVSNFILVLVCKNLFLYVYLFCASVEEKIDLIMDKLKISHCDESVEAIQVSP